MPIERHHRAVNFGPNIGHGTNEDHPTPGNRDIPKKPSKDFVVFKEENDVKASCGDTIRRVIFFSIVGG